MKIDLMELITEAINLAVSEIVEAEQTPPRNEEERRTWS